MRPTTLAAILVVGVAGLGAAAAWVLGAFAPSQPADPFAERFAALTPAPPSPALQAHAARLLFDGALAFVPAYLNAPRSVDALAPHDMAARNGAALAFVLPRQPLLPVPEPPADPNAVTPSSVSPLDHVPLPPTRPKIIIDNDRVIDDDAIAKLKQRLRLTAAQERLWPPIETALRDLTWRRSGRNGAPSLEIEALQRLKTASDNLMEALREDQKREVKLLMHVVGL